MWSHIKLIPIPAEIPPMGSDGRNGDARIRGAITTTLTPEEADGHLEQNGVVISEELSKKLVNAK